MVLSNEQQEKLSGRLAGIRDYGGEKRVAELANVTPRVIQKAMTGGNVQVKTIESILGALNLVEGERRATLKKLDKALA